MSGASLGDVGVDINYRTVIKHNEIIVHLLHRNVGILLEMAVLASVSLIEVKHFTCPLVEHTATKQVIL
jgi:hypothetical protein